MRKTIDHVCYENDKKVSFCLECDTEIEEGQGYCESCYDKLCKMDFFDYEEGENPF